MAEITWIEVADSAVKIGFGALIGAVASIITLWLNHKHENRKDQKAQQRKLADRKKWLYIEFLSESHALLQKYREGPCPANGEDFLNYLRVYHELQITSADIVREGAFHLLNAVTAFIISDNISQELGIVKQLRVKADEEIGKFQLLAKLDVRYQR